MVSSDLRRGLSSPIEHHSCRIQVCSTTQGACTCMFNHLQHLRLASTLGQVIRLDLGSARAMVSQCNVASHLAISIPMDRAHSRWHERASYDGRQRPKTRDGVKTYVVIHNKTIFQFEFFFFFLLL